jgi:flagellar hook-associated protein 3 FlgL
MYANFISNLNAGSSKLMELNNQASSQKKINRPSDDPVGTIRVMEYRDSISALKQFKSNIDTGKGWLELADETLMQGNELLTRAKAVAEQAATGSLSAEQRDGLSYEVEQIFEQLISLSNTSYEGKSIFAGQRVDGNAFERTLNVTSNKDDIQDEDIISITGEKGGTVLVQFEDDGTVDSTGGANIGYRYSKDGGNTWTTVDSTDTHALNNSGNTTLNLDGTEVRLSNGYAVEASEDTNDSSGTWLWVRPSARYMGDNENNAQVTSTSGNSDEQLSADGEFDSEVTVEIGSISGSNVQYRYSTDGGTNWSEWSETSDKQFVVPGGRMELQSDISTISSGEQFTITPSTHVDKMAENADDMTVIAQGDFSSNTVVRIDSNDGTDIEYSYSTDGGTSWSTGNTTTTSESKYVVPGGLMEITPDSVDVTEGDQFAIRARKAGIDFQISPNESLQVNNIGKDVFGGIMGNAEGSIDKTVFGRGSGDNVFETMGEFIGYLKTNNQSGIQESLEKLGSNIKHISNTLASVGSRENRLDVAEKSMTSLIGNEEERMSNIEDVDIAELMTKLSSQQVAYQAVLQSSSRIMKMSLMNYI